MPPAYLFLLPTHRYRHCPDLTYPRQRFQHRQHPTPPLVVTVDTMRTAAIEPRNLELPIATLTFLFTHSLLRCCLQCCWIEMCILSRPAIYRICGQCSIVRNCTRRFAACGLAATGERCKPVFIRRRLYHPVNFLYRAEAIPL